MTKATKAAKPKKTGGRPKGATKPPTAETVETSCPKCGSTDRTRYTTKNVQPYKHVHAGHSYSHIIRRRTRCQGCGQHRIDRTRENRPD